MKNQDANEMKDLLEEMEISIPASAYERAFGLEGCTYLNEHRGTKFAEDAQRLTYASFKKHGRGGAYTVTLCVASWELVIKDLLFHAQTLGVDREQHPYCRACMVAAKRIMKKVRPNTLYTGRSLLYKTNRGRVASRNDMLKKIPGIWEG